MHPHINFCTLRFLIHLFRELSVTRVTSRTHCDVTGSEVAPSFDRGRQRHLKVIIPAPTIPSHQLPIVGPLHRGILRHKGALLLLPFLADKLNSGGVIRNVNVLRLAVICRRWSLGGCRAGCVETLAHCLLPI